MGKADYVKKKRGGEIFMDFQSEIGPPVRARSFRDSYERAVRAIMVRTHIGTLLYFCVAK